MTRILVVGMTPTYGGVEAFILNYYRYLDKENYHLDFLCSMEDSVACEEEITGNGSLFFHVVSKRKNPVKHRIQLLKFFRTNAVNYDVIWVNLNSLANIDFLKLAKRFGIRKRIIHSHNSANMGGRIQYLLHSKNRKCIKKYATDLWACSESAAIWFYGRDVKDVIIIKNAIPIEKYFFSPEKRTIIRKELGWENQVIWGNVGRLHFQKNQKFIIDLLDDEIQRNNAIRVVLVGEGPKKDELEAYIKIKGLEKYVKMVGKQDDICGYLSAFDVLVFPSKFEGLSITALEAQANGVPIVASKKAITLENKINSNVRICNLDDTKGVWINEIAQASADVRIEKTEAMARMQSRGYDISKEVRILETLFE